VNANEVYNVFSVLRQPKIYCGSILKQIWPSLP